MHVRLELRQDEFRYQTIHSTIGPYRYLHIKIDGRPFVVWYRLDSFRMSYDEEYMKGVDEQLAAQFQRMVEKVLTKALADVPEGADLLSNEDRA